MQTRLGKFTRQKSWLVTIVLVGLLVAGCGIEDYNIVIKNTGSRRIDRACVMFGGFRSVGGLLPPDIWSKHMRPDRPIPDIATVEWRTDDGVLHRQDVEVRKILPRRFRGDIQFEIDDSNNVSIRVIPQ